MDVRSARDVAPVIEHAGTVPVWWLIQPGKLRHVTSGGFLELVSECKVAGGGLVDPQSHPTHEFYYIISGRGIMKIADEKREVGQRGSDQDSTGCRAQYLAADRELKLRGLAFAVGIEGAGPVDYTS
jgi:hypothetical protein